MNLLFFRRVTCFDFIGLYFTTMYINNFCNRDNYVTFNIHLLSEMYHIDAIEHDTCKYKPVEQSEFGSDKVFPRFWVKRNRVEFTETESE